jgi:hypothetical protein
MSLLKEDDEVMAPEVSGSGNDAEMSASKKAYLKRQAAKKEAYDKSIALRAALKDAGAWDILGDDLKAFVNDTLCADPANKQRVNGGDTMFNLVFGTDAQVGDQVSLRTAFSKTLKGEDTLKNVWLKRWEKAGIKVTYNRATGGSFDDVLDQSMFTIVSMNQ